MDILEICQKLLRIATEKFGDIVEHGEVLLAESGEPLKLRLNIIDGSIVDIFFSLKGKYSFHWERREINGTIYRHDNAPHRRWRDIKTFPKHFHNGSEENCKESYLNNSPAIAIEEFLRFVRQKLIEKIRGD